ncbi:MAG: SRPBCC family protein [Vicinamibacterales bacterium]
MHLHAETWVAVPRREVFPFFADAANLQRLTPPWLHFTIRSPQPIPMRAGTRIEYRIRVRGLPMRWLSEISGYDPPDAFVDTQIRGPYRRWVHTHRFIEDRGGTLIVDDVEFEVPGWRVGEALVVPDLRRIFTFRHNALLSAFSEQTPWPPPRITIGRRARATSAGIVAR